MGASLSSPSELNELTNKVRFLLYSDPNNTGRYVEISHWSPDAIRRTNYNTVFPVTVLVHGFNNTFEGSFLQDTKNALLRQKIQTNVVMMDYRDFSRIGLINFPDVIPYVPALAQRLTDFLLFLISSNMTTGPQSVHLIGESLGAQICALVGKGIQEIKGSKIMRITGLDPAGIFKQFVSLLKSLELSFDLDLTGPCFQGESEEVRLCPTDATFVDVVHSNQGRLGYRGSCGMIDFYLNGGGPIQPKYKENHDPGWIGLDRNDLSHAFSVELFTETIQKKVYYGCGCFGGKKTCETFDLLPRSCPNHVLFGYHTPKTSRGEFYVRAYIEPEGKK